MNFDTIPFYIEQLLGFFTSPWSAVLIIVGFGVVLTLLNVPSARWAMISCLLYTSTFGVALSGTAVGAGGQLQMAQLAFPLSILQTNARTLSFLCAAFLLLPTMTAARGRRISFMTAAFLCFFLLQMWICVRLTLGWTAATRAALDLIVSLLMFATLIVGVGRWMQTPDDARNLLKAIVGFGLLFVLGNVYEILLVPSTAHQLRLTGTTPDAQSVGQICSLVFVPTLYLIQDKMVSPRWRLTSIMVAGATLLMLLWSGSRTGILMGAVGTLFLFGVRLHRLILPAVGVVIALWLGYLMFPMAFAGVARFADTTNDRAQAWNWMLSQFFQNPVVGMNSNGMGYRESVFLSTLAFFGAIGGAVLLLCVALAGLMLLKLVRHRRAMGPNAGLISAVMALFAMLFVAAVFEDSLLALLSPATMMLFLSFALLAFCRDEIQLNEQWPAAAMPDAAGLNYAAPQVLSDLSWY